MPEGDTIFRTARTLDRALRGKAVTGFRSTFPLLTRFHDDAPLTGREVVRVESRGKWVLMHFSGGAILATHMRMNGSWHIYRTGERWQQPAGNMRVAIETADFVAVGFNVPVAEMLDARSIERDPRIPAAASDMLGGSFDAGGAAEGLLALGDMELGEALLRQKVLAGVGNVYKSEICFACGLNPFGKAGTLTKERAAEVVSAAERLLAANVLEDSGAGIVTYRGRMRRATRRPDPGESLWVYGRAGQPCRRCGTAVLSRLQGAEARVTYWCPQCQPIADLGDPVADSGD